MNKSCGVLVFCDIVTVLEKFPPATVPSMATISAPHLLVIIWVAIVSIATTVISICTVYRLCRPDSPKWIDKTYRNLTIIVTILFTASAIWDFLHILLISPLLSITITPTIENIITFAASATYLIGDNSFYVLILMRIYVPFELSKCITYFLTFCMVIFFVDIIVWCWGCFGMSFAGGLEWLIIHSITMIIDLILNVTVFTVFISKMRRMITDIDASLSREAARNVNLISNTIIKHSILFGVAMIINQSFYSVCVYGDTLVLWTYEEFKDIVYSVRGLENIVNIVVLWLLLRVNYDQYICFCGCCHRCIGKCCFKDIDSKQLEINPYLELKGVEESEIALQCK